MTDLEKILSLNTNEMIDTYIKENSLDPSEEFRVSEISERWTPVGGNYYNSGAINQLKDGEKGIVERITNSVDAITEKIVETNNLNTQKLDNVVKIGFPEYYKHIKNLDMETGTLSPKDANNQIKVIVNEGSKSTDISVDILDAGIGIQGKNFSKTILSLHSGNKSHVNKNYLIGTFGQGGSTSLNYTKSTIIVSKKNNEISYTIVRPYEPINLKQQCFYYLVDEETGNPILVDDKKISRNHYLYELSLLDSFTLVKMIDTNISPKFRKSATKPYSLLSYVDCEIPKLPYPIKFIENRQRFKDTKSTQNRYAYGLINRIKTNKKNFIEKYSGIISFLHQGVKVNVKYYVVLPSRREDWYKNSECKKVYERYNTTGKSILYTAGGQYINGEYFTKIKHAGLSYLENRLLVLVDLDVFEKQKYKFFTSNRADMAEHEITRNFYDKIIERLVMQDGLIELNELIKSETVIKGIDSELNSLLNDRLKKYYYEYLNPTNKKIGIVNRGENRKNQYDIKYSKVLEKIDFYNNKPFYKNEKIKFIVKTNLWKGINEKLVIDMFVDGKYFSNYEKSTSNGTIFFNDVALEPGIYEVFFQSGNLESQSQTVEVLNTNKDFAIEGYRKNINFNIFDVNDPSAKIIDIVKNSSEREIEIKINLNNKLLHDIYMFHSLDENEVDHLKPYLKKGLILFAMFNDKSNFFDYLMDENEISNEEIENKVYASYAESLLLLRKIENI